MTIRGIQLGDSAARPCLTQARLQYAPCASRFLPRPSISTTAPEEQKTRFQTGAFINTAISSNTGELICLSEIEAGNSPSTVPLTGGVVEIYLTG